jgi:hypothetical protein
MHRADRAQQCAMLRPMKIVAQAHFPIPPERLYSLLQRTEVVSRIAFPLLVFHARDRAPMGELLPFGPYRVWMWVLGVIPLGSQTLRITRHESEGRFQLHDAGSGWIAQRWDHWQCVTPAEGGALYRDEIEVEAGLLTPFVAAFAWAFVRWRHRRLSSAALHQEVLF